MKSQREVIDQFDREYDQVNGFLGRLRTGSFDAVGAERFLEILSSLDLGEGPVDLRLVQLLWFTPMFLQWQKERFELMGSDASDVEATLNQIVTVLEDVIGAP